jgi:hypothetical protein
MTSMDDRAWPQRTFAELIDSELLLLSEGYRAKNDEGTRTAAWRAVGSTKVGPSRATLVGMERRGLVDA